MTCSILFLATASFINEIISPYSGLPDFLPTNKPSISGCFMRDLTVEVCTGPPYKILVSKATFGS